MHRILWLTFEKPPHPDAVRHPATAEDVLFALELLTAPVQYRQRLAEQLRGYLDLQAGLAPWARPAIPCRRMSGWYSLVPWRFAKWLSVVLPATPGALERTQQQLQTWLNSGGPAAVSGPASNASGSLAIRRVVPTSGGPPHGRTDIELSSEQDRND